MGYSCTAAASATLAYIERAYQSPETDAAIMYINGKNYFFERGKENADGAITGRLMLCVDSLGNPAGFYAAHCRVAGSVRIAPDGLITRFPGLRRNQKMQINVLAKGGRLPYGPARGL